MSSVNIENLLYEETGDHFEKLQDATLDPETRKAAFNETMALMDRVIELEKIEADSRDKVAARESEELLKQQQAKSENKERWMRFGIDAAKFVMSIGATLFVVHKSMEFEKTDNVTTMAGRWSIQNAFSFLKIK